MSDSPATHCNMFTVNCDKNHLFLELYYRDVGSPVRQEPGNHLIAKIVLDHISAAHLASEVVKHLKLNGPEDQGKRP
jgi:hypothetical protein